MTVDVPPLPIACPVCAGPLPFTAGREACPGCDAVVSVATFRPLLSAAALAAGEGRCLTHPRKDAVDACGRCGAYVCDVCVTRTGEHLLCPACFDLLHDRKELATTRTRRVRWDRMCVPALLLGLVGCGPLAPVALALAVFALWRRRKEPWLSPWPPIAAIAIVVVPMLAIAGLLLVRAYR